MELGYALALERPIHAYHVQPREQLPHLLQGIDVFPNVVLSRYGSLADLVALLTNTLGASATHGR